MRVCHKCNSEIDDAAAFCPHCGGAAAEPTEPEPELELGPELELDPYEFDNTLNMPFSDEVALKIEQTQTPPPELGERTLEDPPSIDAGLRAKTLESDNLEQFIEPILSGKVIAGRAIDSFDEIEVSLHPVQEERVNTNAFAPSEASFAETRIDASNIEKPAAKSDSDGKTSGLKPLIAGIVLNSRYEIVHKIGGGGMGAVYLAHDRNLGGVERAVKEMVQTSIEEEQQKKAIEDFKRESMILTALDHPSIPTIYDYFFDERESRFYLVMKYISGGDLASRLRAAPGGRFDEKTVCDWALQIIDVLSYLHSLPTTIVYRDLKPSNIMVDDKTGRVMIIDFGIARSIDQGREQGVTAVGTMGYAPPELFSGNVEPRSDIYSLGSTMFHLMTGADPQNNPLLIFDFQKNPRPRQINPQLSDQIERILMRSVEYNAEARFSSAAEMQEILSHHLENLKNGNITHGVTEIPAAVSLAHQNVFCGFCGQRIVATDLFSLFAEPNSP